MIGTVIAGVFSLGCFLFAAAILWQVRIDHRRDRREEARWRAYAAEEDVRKAAAEEQVRIDAEFEHLTDPAHFGKTGGPA